MKQRLTVTFALVLLACSSPADPAPDGMGADAATVLDMVGTDHRVDRDDETRGAELVEGDNLEGDLASDEIVEPEERLNLATDADRDGKASFTDPDDEELEETWSLKGGAVFLVNLDDDDGDGKADALDDVVNGSNDALDLAPIYLAAAPWLPVGASLELTGSNVDSGRLFRFANGAWSAVVLPLDLPAAELADDPIVLGFEGRDEALILAVDPAERVVSFTLVARDEDGVVLAEDRAEMHAAPLLVASALQPIKQAYMFEPADEDGAAFFVQLGNLLDGANLPLTQVPHDGGQSFLADHVEMALTILPRAGGHVVQNVALLSGSDAGTTALAEAMRSLDTMPLRIPGDGDGYGALTNVESSPVLLAGAMYFPYGRLYYGYDGTSNSGPPAALLTLLERQGLQGSPVAVDTSFLHSGRICEVVAWVPYTGDPGCCGKGFRMLLADPGLAVALLGQEVDEEVAAYNLGLAASLAAVEATLLPALDLLPDEDMIRVPALFAPHPDTGLAVPMMPTVTDGIPAGKAYLAPAPVTPSTGFDLLSDWLEEALAPINAVVHFLPLGGSCSAELANDVGGLYRTVVTRRRPDNVEWWLWFM